MESTHQLLEYTEQERLALISCIASIATLDKVANEEEIEFILALVEAADLDALKMKTVVDAAKDPQNKALKGTLEPIAQSEDSLHFFANEVLPFIRSNKELNNQKKIRHIIEELGITETQYSTLENFAESHVELFEGSFLEKMVLSLYLKMKVAQEVMA